MMPGSTSGKDLLVFTAMDGFAGSSGEFSSTHCLELRHSKIQPSLRGGVASRGSETRTVVAGDGGS